MQMSLHNIWYDANLEFDEVFGKRKCKHDNISLFFVKKYVGE